MAGGETVSVCVGGACVVVVAVSVSAGGGSVVSVCSGGFRSFGIGAVTGIGTRCGGGSGGWVVVVAIVIAVVVSTFVSVIGGSVSPGPWIVDVTPLADPS